MVRDKHFDILLIRWHDFPGNQSGSQFSHSVMSDSLRLRGLQHTRLPCPSPTPRSYSNSCPCQGCHPTISSSVVPFSSRLQSFPAPGSFQISQFFTSSGQSIGISASTSVTAPGKARSGRRFLGTNGATLWLWSCLHKPGAPGP